METKKYTIDVDGRRCIVEVTPDTAGNFNYMQTILEKVGNESCIDSLDDIGAVDVRDFAAVLCRIARHIRPWVPMERLVETNARLENPEI